MKRRKLFLAMLLILTSLMFSKKIFASCWVTTVCSNGLTLRCNGAYDCYALESLYAICDGGIHFCR